MQYLEADLAAAKLLFYIAAPLFYMLTTHRKTYKKAKDLEQKNPQNNQDNLNLGIIEAIRREQRASSTISGIILPSEISHEEKDNLSPNSPS